MERLFLQSALGADIERVGLMTQILKKISLAAFLSLALITTAAADVLVFHDGRRVEGDILSVTEKKIVIRIRRGSSHGEATFSRSMVAKIERKVSAFKLNEAEYKVRLKAAADADTIDSWEKLATWCEDKGFHGQRKQALRKAFALREAAATASGSVAAMKFFLNWADQKNLDTPKVTRRIYERILQIDPDDQIARKGLGYKFYKNQWYTEAQYNAAYDADMLAKGFVKYKGTWYSPEGLAALAKVIAADKLKKELKILKEQNQILLQNQKNQAQQIAQINKELEQARRERASLLLVARQCRDLEIALDAARRRIRSLERRPVTSGTTKGNRR